MKPEELNRAMEFLIQSQARLAVAQEQYQEWTKGVLAQLTTDHERIVELIGIQSHRLDRNEVFHREFLREFRQEAQEARRRHEEALARLDRILGKLTDRKN